jgi:hypothetical protein
MISKKPVPDLILDGNRFPAFAKPASAGEARSEKHALGLDPRDHAHTKCEGRAMIQSNGIGL